MKRRALKAKDDCSFWSSGKRRKGFSKINNSVKYSLQRWIIYHPRIIQYPIENDYITVKFDGVVRGVKTELRHKVLLRLSIPKLHIDMLKKDDTGFSMSYYEKGLVHISDYALQLIFPPKLQRMTHCHKIIRGCEIFIQDGT